MDGMGVDDHHDILSHLTSHSSRSLLAMPVFFCVFSVCRTFLTCWMPADLNKSLSLANLREYLNAKSRFKVYREVLCLPTERYIFWRWLKIWVKDPLLWLCTELFGDGWMMVLKGKPGMFLQRSLWYYGGVSRWMLSICAMLDEEWWRDTIWPMRHEYVCTYTSGMCPCLTQCR